VPDRNLPATDGAPSGSRLEILPASPVGRHDDARRCASFARGPAGGGHGAVPRSLCVFVAATPGLLCLLGRVFFFLFFFFLFFFFFFFCFFFLPARRIFNPCRTCLVLTGETKNIIAGESCRGPYLLLTCHGADMGKKGLKKES